MGHFLVTGASSGIGRATAVMLAESGHHVLLVGRDYGRLRETHAMLDGDQHNSLSHFRHDWRSVDLAALDDGGMAEMIDAAVEKRGCFDGLVHAAGVHSLEPIRHAFGAGADEMMRINYGTAWRLAKAFRRPAVRSPHTSIVFVSSVAGIVGQPATSQYAASKAALIGLTKALAVELAPHIRVNCVAPGVVETPMQERLKDAVGDSQWQAIEDAHPLGVGQPEDVAEAICYLLHQSWTTGTVLTIDGGYTAK